MRTKKTHQWGQRFLNPRFESKSFCKHNKRAKRTRQVLQSLAR